MSTQKRFWVPDDDDCGKNKRQKTAIEQEMEEAEEYELRKETEQRRKKCCVNEVQLDNITSGVQQLKLLSLDHQLRKTQASTDRRCSVPRILSQPHPFCLGALGHVHGTIAARNPTAVTLLIFYLGLCWSESQRHLDFPKLMVELVMVLLMPQMIRA